MRKSIILASAALALTLAPLGFSQSSSLFKTSGQDAFTVDQRGVVTLAPLLERVTPAVVNISVTTGAKDPDIPDEQAEMMERFFGFRMPDQQNRRRGSIGSGVIINADKGYVMTNHHVIDGADEIVVTLKDNREIDAELIGSDPKTDIAVLKIDASNLSELDFAPDDQAKVGDYVIAIGNPFGLGQTVTTGIISGLGRGGNRGGQYEDFIQTDAAINMGNSGGPLVNSRGQIIGINTQIYSRSGGNDGIGFAVPSDMAQGVMRQLVSYGEVRRGRIGVTIQNISPDLKDALNLPTSNGALVNSVLDDSPADKAGLEEGDIIIEFNGEDINNAADIRNAVGLVEAGKRAPITYLRDGRRRTTQIGIAAFDEEDEVSEEAVDQDDPDMESFSGASITNIPDDVELRGGDAGVYVSAVERASRAYRAGLRRGDIIRSVNMKPVSDLRAFERAIDGGSGPYALSVERDGSNIFVAVR